MAENKLSEKRVCGHCGNRAPMVIVGEYKEKEIDADLWNNAQTCLHYGEWYQLLKCQGCDKIEIRVHSYHDAFDDLPDYKTLYPIGQSVPDGLPKKVKAEYERALKARHGDANGYGVLLGRVLEAVCHDKNANGKMLGSQLEDLAKKNLLPNEILAFAKQLNSLRVVGAHFNVGKLTKKEVPIMEQLTKVILEYVYSAPYIMKQAEKAVKKLDKKKPKIADAPAKSTVSPHPIPLPRKYIEGEPSVLYEEIEGLMIDCERQFLDLIKSQKVIKYDSAMIPVISRSIRQTLSNLGYRDFVLANHHDTHYLVPKGVDPKFSV